MAERGRGSLPGHDAGGDGRAFKTAWKALDWKTRRRIARMAVRGEPAGDPWHAQWVVAFSTHRLRSPWQKPWVTIPLFIVMFAGLSIAAHLIFGWDFPVFGGVGALIGYTLVVVYQTEKMKQAIQVNQPIVTGTPPAPVHGSGPPAPR